MVNLPLQRWQRRTASHSFDVSPRTVEAANKESGVNRFMEVGFRSAADGAGLESAGSFTTNTF
jgi:hypothetical protein